jgi:colanic acid biosynthesis glycosyl transferase WcaI
MMERLHAKGVMPERTRLFPNWVDAERIRPLSRASTYRAELQIDCNTVVALFSGTLGPKQGLSIIPQAARRLAHRPDVLFLICGDGLMKPALQQACGGLANVRLLPLQPTERLCELLNLADIHLLTQSPGAEDLVLPSKLTGMLASGRPIVATCRQGSEIASVVDPCGIIVAPENADELAGAIECLADDASRRRALGAQARLWAERSLTLDAILGRVAQELEGTAAGTGITVADRG